MSKGATIWLTGLPSAGKSTLARELAAVLPARTPRVEILDGDEIRANLSPELGFSRADRIENVRRIGWLAQLLARNGVTVLVPVIAPYVESRELVRKLHEMADTPYFEIHVATALGLCVQRDVKGLYARQAHGEIKGLTGVDDPYEEPAGPELRVDTASTSPRETAAEILGVLLARGLV